MKERKKVRKKKNKMKSALGEIQESETAEDQENLDYDALKVSYLFSFLSFTFSLIQLFISFYLSLLHSFILFFFLTFFLSFIHSFIHFFLSFLLSLFVSGLLLISITSFFTVDGSYCTYG